jgi:hypothetical protein
MSTTTSRRIAPTVATALAALAVAVPAASARPITDPPTKSTTETNLSTPRATHRPEVTIRVADDGFDWASAGVGAAAVGGVLLIALGGVSAAHHARLRAAR